MEGNRGVVSKHMKTLQETLKQTRAPEENLMIRTNRESLIAQIVEATNEKNKKILARRLAICANILGWTETDMHYLLKKRADPSIKNYTAFVKWNCRIKKV